LNDIHSAVTAITTNQTRHYTVVCSSCGRRQHDDGLILDCPAGHAPALLQSEYAERRFSPRYGREDLFRYQDWLPITQAPHHQDVTGRTAVYRSAGISRALGMPNLWIAFNGYWPERGAALETATFKEFEAYAVLGRLPEHQVTLTVASSGNTGAAFAWACSQRQIPCLLVVPGKALRRLKFRTPLHPCVKLVTIDDGGYGDAIELAASISREPTFQAEGGVKNIARRDGLATVLLSAFEEMQCLPSHYFQAVGSGTGAIAVLKAAKRLRGAIGDAASRLPKLMMCQNLPFTPIYDAWLTRRRSPGRKAAECYRKTADQVFADELTNWAPPYEVRGGVYDSLLESHGDVLVADNAAVRTAMTMFEELEGVDIEPASGVALACLRDAVSRKTIGREDVVLLNVTGGGRNRLGRDCRLIPARPQLRLTRKSLGGGEAAHKILSLCAPAVSMA
jgi:cysteate synthase